MLTIKIIPPLSTIRCSIQSTGRLYFTYDAIEYLDLTTKHCIAIGKNEEDASDENLYMYVYDKVVPNTYKINSSGTYLYLNTKQLFTKLAYGYLSQKINFNIELVQTEGDKVYKLVRYSSPR